MLWNLGTCSVKNGLFFTLKNSSWYSLSEFFWIHTSNQSLNVVWTSQQMKIVFILSLTEKGGVLDRLWLKSKSKYSDPSLRGEEYLDLDLSGLGKKLPEENLVQVLLWQFLPKSTQVQVQVLQSLLASSDRSTWIWTWDRVCQVLLPSP